MVPSPQRLPVPEWHRRIIQERLESYKAKPVAGRPWPDVRHDIEERLQNR
ncbi:MAG: addiction module protein [Nitrospiraceae bacterium]